MSCSPGPPQLDDSTLRATTNEVPAVKEGWLQERGRSVKTWRPRASRRAVPAPPRTEGARARPRPDAAPSQPPLQRRTPPDQGPETGPNTCVVGCLRGTTGIERTLHGDSPEGAPWNIY
uniref:RAC-beta serine/threonine-protein kinase-like n=1 Tax=Camelus bactrianus TaxID=9837 RepID=A0A9W3H9T2_CAMBA|nr:RAC-beta serine/threonine-protein kinase-like [Camelus bactrianus]